MAKPKTFKREVAVSALLTLYIFIGYTLYNLANLNQTSSMVELIGMLIIPTFATVAAAFGIDSYFRQHPKSGDKVDSEESNSKLPK